MTKKNKKQTYKQQRRENLIEDNEREDAGIKKLSKKLGLARRKPRKDGGEIKPSWMRESGLDYFLDFEKHSTCDDGGDLGKGTDTLGTKKSVTKGGKNCDIFGQKMEEDNLLGAADDNDDAMSSSDVDNSSMEIIDQVTDVEEAKSSNQKKEDKPSEKMEFDEDIVGALRRDIRRLLNCVSEAQMSRTISDVVKLFNDRPRALVRKIIIEEIDILLGSFPFSRGQSLGWLQQELASCFVSAQGWLDQSGQDSRLVAHLAEFLVTKIPNLVSASPEIEIDGGTLASRCVFIAYLYRFGALTGDIVLDILEEFVKFNSLSVLQAAHQVVKPVSSVLRKEHPQRCQELINFIREKLPLVDTEDFEKVSEMEGIVKCLSEKHSKEPALSNADQFVKMMRTWNKGISLKKEARLPLRLEELRCAGSRGRWWAVGSAFHGNSLHASAGPHMRSANNQINLDDDSCLAKEVLDAATELGLITPMRRNLFSILVSTPGGPDSTTEALIRACGFTGRKNKSMAGVCSGSGTGGGEHREREMIQIIMHCLVSEQPFNRFYARVLGGLLNNHRRFGIMIRCAFWDVMAKDKLTKEAKMNAGKAIGILAVLYDFPLSVLKKYSFGDVSDANVALLTAVVEELTASPFSKALEKCAQLAGASPRLSRNLRIFMRRMGKLTEDEIRRTFLQHLVNELRDLFP